MHILTFPCRCIFHVIFIALYVCWIFLNNHSQINSPFGKEHFSCVRTAEQSEMWSLLWGLGNTRQNVNNLQLQHLYACLFLFPGNWHTSKEMTNYTESSSTRNQHESMNNRSSSVTKMSEIHLRNPMLTRFIARCIGAFNLNVGNLFLTLPIIPMVKHNIYSVVTQVCCVQTATSSLVG